MAELSDTQIEVLKRLSAAGLNSEQIKQLDRGVNKSGFASGGGKGGEAAPAKAAPKAKAKNYQTGFGEKNFLNPVKTIQQAHAKNQAKRANAPSYAEMERRRQQEATQRRMTKNAGTKPPATPKKNYETGLGEKNFLNPKYMVKSFRQK